VVAPGCRIEQETADRVQALVRSLYPRGGVEVWFHPQCFLSEGHFAGPDTARIQAFLDVANDESFDALWWARGGYGACRLVEAVMPRLEAGARRKAYLGYSDAGTLLGALYAAGFPQVAHGPIVQDVRREGGEAAIARALAWLTRRDPAALEPSVGRDDAPTAAFNMVILTHLLGTPWAPDLGGHVLMLEEVAEHMYRIDRHLFHITSQPAMRRLAGIRLGRCSAIPENDPDFVLTEEAVVRHWCAASGIPYLGRADIGHDADNKVVPFGT